MNPNLAPRTGEKLYRRVQKLMGNRFELTILAEDDHRAAMCLDAAVAEIQRIEAALTTFSDSSLTHQINAMAGLAPIQTTQEVYDLIARSLRLSELTQGAFDITYGGVDKSLWNFDPHMEALPSAEVAKTSVRRVNYRKVLLNPQDRSVFLQEEGMRIGFGGISKGYAAERSKAVLQKMGVKSGIVNAAADYFAGYQQHAPGEQLYISDYDLSEFTSHYAGLNFRITSVEGVFGVKKLNILEVRLGHYNRSNGLVSNAVSLATTLK